MHPPKQPIIAFRPNKARTNDGDETFTGNLLRYSFLSQEHLNDMIALAVIHLRWTGARLLKTRLYICLRHHHVYYANLILIINQFRLGLIVVSIG